MKTILTLNGLVHEFVTERLKNGNRYYQIFEGEIVNEFSCMSLMSNEISSMQRRGFSVSFQN